MTEPAYPAHWEADVVLRDGRTAHLVRAREDDHDAFLQGCCGDFDHYRAERFGGTVLVRHETEVRIWFPKDRSHPTVHVQP